ncbi:MAG: hypothetical protein WAX89_07000 [Alphaproteobacteria bacterium]
MLEPHLQMWLGLLASVLALVCYVPYYIGIFAGRVKPHLYTYVVWTLVSTIAVAGGVASGGGPGMWSLILSTLLCAGVIVLCPRYGTKDITATDKAFGGLAIVSVIPWLLTKDPTFSVVLATLIEILGAIPTYRKTWHAPDTESLSSWSINVVKHVLTIPAMATLSVATIFYPIAMVAMNLTLVLIILYRRTRIPRRAE